uniref:Uncharacterized protein n=1 Tax=Avena sativa TaxID=4498 RepID=A0ACD5V946_AVESA
MPVHVQAVWDVKIPPKIHFFLWFVSHNRVLTRVNLVKRQKVDDLTCLFCNKLETCNHIFFECVVATAAWKEVGRITGNIPVNIEMIADRWEKNKLFKVENVMYAAIMWSIWLIRNDLCFKRAIWPGMQEIWRRCAYNLVQWGILLGEGEKGKLNT